ncbi:MAG: VanW family protein [Evtepia sp.]|nr:VanW family protein [Evtepia sp.]
MFCDINPTCYKIALQKEICKRHIKNFLGHEVYAALYDTEPLPQLVSACSSHLIKRGKGIEPKLQENKAININLANQTMNGILLRPGETFSFWKLVGKTTKRKGYQEGRVLVRSRILPGLGGGLCNLANTIHRVVLLSPLTVTEFHQHSDALAPDEGERVPFSSGTSVFYNNGDYRFRNDTDQTFQLLLWCDADNLYAELRCEQPLPHCYRIVEEGHHFQKEGEKYYRVSKIYKETADKASGQIIDKALVLDNHSEVMYDPNLIPGVETL